jgi:hypothetical protein
MNLINQLHLGSNEFDNTYTIISSTDTPGTITFNNDGSLIQTAGNVMAPGAWGMSGKHMLVLFQPSHMEQIWKLMVVKRQRKQSYIRLNSSVLLLRQNRQISPRKTVTLIVSNRYDPPSFYFFKFKE